jgi:hypothetical protein
LKEFCGQIDREFMRNFICGFVILFSLSASAQKITGLITDASNEEPMPFTTVQIVGTASGTVSEIDGTYSLKVAPGTYTLEFSFIGFETQTISGVRVTKDGATLNVSIKPDQKRLDDVIVTAKKLVDTEEAVVEEVKQADQVVSAVSSEEISKTEASNAGEVVSRIPGITLIDGRFIIVRGLSQRYNSVRMNGMPMPSTDPSTKAFSFDIVPSSVIESAYIYKSFTPDLSGEVAGAAVNINTKNNVDENYDEIGFKVGYRVNTTFKQDLTDASRSLEDYFSFGKGGKEWPSSVDSKLIKFNEEPAASAIQAQSFDNQDFFAKSFTAAPDFGISYNFGRIFQVADRKLSMTNAVSLSNSTKTRTSKVARYSEYTDNAPTNLTTLTNQTQTNRKANLMAMSNFSYDLAENVDLRFQNLYNRVGTSSALRKFQQDPGDSQRERDITSLDYIDENIFASQLGANIWMNDHKDLLDVVGGYAFTQFNQPNRRTYYLDRRLGTDEEYQLLLPDGAAALKGTTRFRSEMKEQSVSLGLNYTHEFSNEDNPEGGNEPE